MNRSHSFEKCAFPTIEPFSYEGEDFDRLLHAWEGPFTAMLSPEAYQMAFADLFINILNSPGKQGYLLKRIFENQIKLLHYCLQNPDHNNEPCAKGHIHDKRFQHESWKIFPFNVFSQSFLLNEQLWDDVSTNVRGLAKHRQEVLNFTGRQILDMFSPSNFPWTNPEIILTTIKEKGKNFVDGFQYLIEDINRHNKGQPSAGTEFYQVGKNIAATKGKVVYRNNLIELIQYESTTSKVKAEPLLIVPAWIMKYYILDLSQHNSLVKFLVDNGHTVFMISWKNPNSEDRNLGLDDYLDLGIFQALEAVNHIVPKQKVHAVGYCMGGTLLTLAAAYMGGQSDNRFKTITLFAAQVDFKDAGELLLFVDESQVTFLEDVMWQKGYLEGAHMARTFNMLRSVDLIWSRMVRTYLLGQKETFNDLMAWNQDTTRLPYKMHSEYLRKLFLNNDLAEGHFKVKNRKIALMDIKHPIFSVSTITDHIAPCKSVYKIHLLTKNEITFVLTSGGHNAGIISEPGHINRTFQMRTRLKGDKYLTLEKWQESAEHFEGSWWPKWQQWLALHSDAEEVAVPSMGNPNEGFPILADAPGTYVFVR